MGPSCTEGHAVTHAERSATAVIALKEIFPGLQSFALDCLSGNVLPGGAA
jgi:hypothetical protein